MRWVLIARILDGESCWNLVYSGEVEIWVDRCILEQSELVQTSNDSAVYPAIGFQNLVLVFAVVLKPVVLSDSQQLHWNCIEVVYRDVRPDRCRNYSGTEQYDSSIVALARQIDRKQLVLCACFKECWGIPHVRIQKVLRHHSATFSILACSFTEISIA